jgi:hypothetical protein
MNDDRADVERLRAYWDGVVHGNPTGPDDLDPSTAATVQRLHALYQPPLPTPEFRDQLKEALVATTMHPESGLISHPWMSRSGRSPNDHLVRRPLPSIVQASAPARGRWILAHVATAALLILMMVGSLVLFGPGRAHRQEEAPDAIPALGATASTPASADPTAVLAPGTTPLLRLTLAEPWPGNMAFVSLFRGTYAPGGYTRDVSALAPQLFFVEAGEVTAHLVAGEGAPVNLGGKPGSAPQLATLGGASPVQVAAGEAGLLLTGTAVELRNEGSTPASVLWLLASPSKVAVERSEVQFDQLAGGVQQAVPPPPMLVGLDRLTLAPDAAMPAEASTETKVGPVDARRTGDLGMASDGSARNLSATPLAIYVLTIAPAGPGL